MVQHLLCPKQSMTMSGQLGLSCPGHPQALGSWVEGRTGVLPFPGPQEASASPRPSSVTSSLSRSSGDGERLGGGRVKALGSLALGWRDRGLGDGEMPAM